MERGRGSLKLLQMPLAEGRKGVSGRMFCLGCYRGGGLDEPPDPCPLSPGKETVPQIRSSEMAGVSTCWSLVKQPPSLCATLASG